MFGENIFLIYIFVGKFFSPLKGTTVGKYLLELHVQYNSKKKQLYYKNNNFYVSFGQV